MKITNFGGNISFIPKYSYTPQTEVEVISILNKHKKNRIRTIGSLHSWNDIVVSNDVIINLKNLHDVRIIKNGNGEVWVEVEGGCTLEELIDKIRLQTAYVLPTIGAITKQTIAGVISTATHGSGNHSISHFIEEMRIAAYDQKTKEAKIYHLKKNDPQLKAARCGLGCMGIILSVRFLLIPSFWVEETSNYYKDLADILEKEKNYPLQQFILLPYLWKYFVYQRKEIASELVPHQINIKRWLDKIYGFLIIDIIAHFILKTLAILTVQSPSLSTQLIPKFYTKVAPVVMRSKTEYHCNHEALTLHTVNHHLFQHVEMEVFIPEKEVREAIAVIKFIITSFADTPKEETAEIKKMLQKIDAWDELIKQKGQYVHHYPLFFRRVLPDNTSHINDKWKFRILHN